MRASLRQASKIGWPRVAVNPLRLMCAHGYQTEWPQQQKVASSRTGLQLQLTNKDALAGLIMNYFTQSLFRMTKRANVPGKRYAG
jgi:hypothetical protein